jgi:hypothetical protein
MLSGADPLQPESARTDWLASQVRGFARTGTMEYSMIEAKTQALKISSIFINL